MTIHSSHDVADLLADIPTTDLRLELQRRHAISQHVSNDGGGLRVFELSDKALATELQRRGWGKYSYETVRGSTQATARRDKAVADADLILVYYAPIRKRPNVNGGDACVGTTRIPVWVLQHLRESGLNDEGIRHAYPQLKDGDLYEAYKYAEANKEEIDNARKEHSVQLDTLPR